MFCQSCGSECPADLNYCNRCGANLSPRVLSETQGEPVSVMKPLLVISALVAMITLGGFALLIDAAIRLSGVFHQSDPLLAMILFGMMTILVTDAMLLRLLSRLILGPRMKKLPKQLKKDYSGGVRQLDARPAMPMSSVTDHTTRTFAPIYKSPGEK